MDTHLGLALVHADDMLRDVEIRSLVALVQDHEEQVKATHDRGADLRYPARTRAIQQEQEGRTRAREPTSPLPFDVNAGRYPDPENRETSRGEAPEA